MAEPVPSSLPCTGTRATSRTWRSVPAGVVTASGDETARTWAADGRPIQELRGHTGSVVAAAFAGRDVVVTAGADGTIRTWDPGTTVELGPARVEGAASAVEARDGRRGSGGGGDRSPSSACGQQPARGLLRGHADLVNTVSFSPDGRLLVSAGRDHDVIVWDVASGEIVHRFSEAHSGSVADARFSPDGRWIVTAGPRSARLWNVADGRDLMYLYGPKPLLTAAAFEPDSRTIVTREESGVVRRYVCELCGDLDELSALAQRGSRRRSSAHASRAGPVPRLTTARDRAYVGARAPRARDPIARRRGDAHPGERRYVVVRTESGPSRGGLRPDRHRPRTVDVVRDLR